MKLTLGFSPCPNDTFIFDALVNGHLDTPGLTFDYVLEDVQQLNELALAGKLDFSKVSFGVFPLIQHQYSLLDAGGALGKGVGPLLISKNPVSPTQVPTSATISLPGEHTTAHLLFSWAFPEHHQKEFRLFSSIEEAVSTGKTDLGVIIHENRFTYQAKGLHLVSDLGTLWEQRTDLPIPLGAIAAKRSIPLAVRRQVEQYIRESIRRAYKEPKLSTFILEHAQELSSSIIQQHIHLYVNEYSLSMGEQGRQAVRSLLEVYVRLHKEGAPVDYSALFS